MTFALDLQRFAEKAGKRADEAVGAIVWAIVVDIDDKSPVGDGLFWKSPPPPGYRGGHFRGNWQLGVDQRITTEIPGVDPGGEQTLARISAAMPSDPAGRIFNISNNTPYSMRIEYGHSRQAPTGVVGITAVRFEQIVEDSVRSLR